MSLVLFFLILVLLIVVHEAGHFAAAKFFGIRVDEFAIGFPPKIASVRRGETEYSINILLFGGFVRIYGERAQDGVPLHPRSLIAKSRWVQAAVVVAGILMNLVAAWVLISGTYMIGMPAETDGTVPHVVNAHLTIVDVAPNSPAARAGIHSGDVVAYLQTATAKMPATSTPAEARAFIAQHADQSLGFVLQRSGHEKVFLVRAEEGVVEADPSRKAVGVAFSEVGTLRLSPIAAFVAGAGDTYRYTLLTAEGLGGFFRDIAFGHPNFASVAGPVGIAQAGSAAADAGWSTLLLFAALISINLALINVLPIPGLDGGRLLILAIEGIKREPVSDAVTAYLTIAGFSLLGLLMVVVTYHDVIRIFFHA